MLKTNLKALLTWHPIEKLGEIISILHSISNSDKTSLFWQGSCCNATNILISQRYHMQQSAENSCGHTTEVPVLTYPELVKVPLHCIDNLSLFWLFVKKQIATWMWKNIFCVLTTITGILNKKNNMKRRQKRVKSAFPVDWCRAKY